MRTRSDAAHVDERHLNMGVPSANEFRWIKWAVLAVLLVAFGVVFGIGAMVGSWV